MKNTSSQVSKISDRAIVNDLAGKVFSASRQRMPIIIAFFYYIFKILISIGAYVSRSFLRVRLGERTFGVISIMFVYVFFTLIQITSELIPVINEELIPQLPSEFKELNFYEAIGAFIIVSSAPQMSSELAPLSLAGLIIISEDTIKSYDGLSAELKYLWWLILGCSIMHFIELFIRRKRGNVVHSYHRGKSFFLSFFRNKKVITTPITNLHIWMIFEPLLVLLFGIIAKDLFGKSLLSYTLFISAFCLFLEEYRVYQENRSMLLDLIDSQIDGTKLSEVQDKYSQRISAKNNNESQGNEFASIIEE